MRDRYFYYYNTGLQNQSVLYARIGLHGAPHVLIDPNKMSKDASVTIGGESPSWNAKLLAYSTSVSGSDWQTWHVRDVNTGTDLPDVLRWGKFSSGAWMPDDKAFLYERYPTPKAGTIYKAALYDYAVYLHHLGTPQSADSIYYYRPDHRNWFYSAGTTPDGHYVIVYASSNDSINNRIGYIDVRDPKRILHELRWKNDAMWGVIDNVGPIFYMTTTLNAPNTEIVAVDVRRPDVMRTIGAEFNARAAGCLRGQSLLHPFIFARRPFRGTRLRAFG